MSTDRARFWEKVDKNGPIARNRPDLGQCWLWTAALRHDYGAFRYRGTMWNALIVSFAWSEGRDPAPNPHRRWHHDHFACDRKNCVNPSHVRIVSARENTLRSDGPARRNILKTHCIRGHAFTPDNIYWNRHNRSCRTCILARRAERRLVAA